MVASPAAIATVTPCAANKQLYAPSPTGLLGALVYESIEDTLHLIGGHPLTERRLEIDDPSFSFYPVGFSPGGVWLAYRTGSPYEGILQTIHLLSSSGEVVQTTPTELVPTEAGTFKGTWGSVLWVNDETMLIYIAQPHPEYPDASPLMIKALLNPFTGEWQPAYLEGLERQQTDTVAFAPDMTRVLFLHIEGPLAEVRLQDTIQQNLLWSRGADLETSFAWEKNWAGGAAWSPDSNWVAFTVIERQEEGESLPGSGVYLLDREGETGKIITDFEARYGRTDFDVRRGSDFATSALSWSPDGRYLAMSVSIASDDPNNPYMPENRLYLYDLKHDELIDLCWFRSSVAGGRSTTNALVWSPDSQYLAYVADPSVSEDNQHLPSTLILVDIYTGEVIELVENAVLLGGWSAPFTP
ncbi:MAG TPA: hypothetical protein PLK31_01845 [Chloroflexota bacterium]|nr:hypothetical protein [Chloroflexota bacterium]